MAPRCAPYPHGVETAKPADWQMACRQFLDQAIGSRHRWHRFLLLRDQNLFDGSRSALEISDHIAMGIQRLSRHPLHRFQPHWKAVDGGAD
jgi:hypothetical protein